MSARNEVGQSRRNDLSASPGNTMSDQDRTTTTGLFATIFTQNWENVRGIKSERIWFMNTYWVISAGSLSLLQGIDGERRNQHVGCEDHRASRPRRTRSDRYRVVPGSIFGSGTSVRKSGS